MKFNKHEEELMIICSISAVLSVAPTEFYGDNLAWFIPNGEISFDSTENEIYVSTDALSQIQEWALKGIAAQFDLDVTFEEDECANCTCSRVHDDTFEDQFDDEEDDEDDKDDELALGQSDVELKLSEGHDSAQNDVRVQSKSEMKRIDIQRGGNGRLQIRPIAEMNAKFLKESQLSDSEFTKLFDNLPKRKKNLVKNIVEDVTMMKA